MCHNDDMHENDLPDLTHIPPGNDICLFCGYTDLRMSVDGLAAKMRYEYGTDTVKKNHAVLWKETGQNQDSVPDFFRLCSAISPI